MLGELLGVIGADTARKDDAPALVERAAQTLGVSPNSLFMFHTMMVEVVEEDVLDAN